MNRFEYGAKSNTRLATCHPALQLIAKDALRMSPYDITIIHGRRGKKVQNSLYDSHVSTKRFPDSRHNKTDDSRVDQPYSMSDALDFAPYINGRIYWEDSHIFAVVAGVFMAAAKQQGFKIRWGGDWDSDGTTTDQTFMDWGHIEITWNH